MQIGSHGIGLFYAVEGFNGFLVVLVQQLSQSSTVGSLVAKVALGLCIVALGNVQVAGCLAVTVGIDATAQQVLSLGEVAVLQGDDTLVGVCLGSIGVHAQCFFDVCLCFSLVAFAESQCSQVVQRTVVVGVELCSLLVDFLTLGIVLVEGSAVEQFLGAQLRGVGSILLLNLLVVAANQFVVHGEACTAQFGQHGTCQVLEGNAQVTDLALTLLRVFIHREHAQNHILVLNVAGLHQTLEAIPVFGCVVSIHIGIHLCGFQLFVHIVLRHILTFAGQTVVQVEPTFGRSECSHLNVIHVHGSALVGIDFLEQFDELLHRIVFQFLFAQVGLVDEEADVGLLFLFLDALERVNGQTGALVEDGFVVEFGCREHTLGNFHGRHFHLFLSHAGVESEVEVAFVHGGGVVEGGLHGVTATNAVRDGLVVAQHLFALESGGRALCYITVGGTQFGNDCNHRLTFHVFLGEFAVDGYRHFSGNSFKGSGSNFEIVG